MPPSDLGPGPRGSLLLRYLDTRAFRRSLPRAVGLQVLHPAIAAAFSEHVHTSVWGHKQRSVEALIRLAADPRAIDHTIRYAHEHVKGVDEEGHRYHALNPELFHFQHATYVETLLTSIDVYGRGQSPEQRDELYAQCCRWYERYGISDRAMPRTLPEFTEYFAAECAELRLTEAGGRFMREVLNPPRWAFGHIPAIAARAIQHERAKQLWGIETTPAQERAFRWYAATRRRG